jgi:hypothetical protein
MGKNQRPGTIRTNQILEPVFYPLPPLEGEGRERGKSFGGNSILSYFI